MYKRILILFVFITHPLGEAKRDRLVFWNVGQGSWATALRTYDCLHFDMGGEFAPPRLLLEPCLNVKNRLYLSHMDWDHMSHLNWWRRQARHICLSSRPRDLKIAPPKKKRKIADLNLCEREHFPPQEIAFALDSKQANALSRVFVYKQFLLPGDSTRTAEQIWAAKAKPYGIKVLALGHHGSRSSTSSYLLQQISTLKVAVVSARRRRYGHPHVEVIRELARRKIPVLETEKWGHLIFQL